MVFQRDIEGGGAGKRGELVKPNAAEAENCIASGIWAGNMNSPGSKRGLKTIHTGLRVVGQDGLLSGGGRKGRRR